ncbi:hypothetical protein EYC80_001215 [Monilinia laxa]|uniref:Zn(2)-C6 fungal-type domain-containing protein n=1 Tax=Monilinia laxa TaxID=61186 RepID=A0A5N6K8K4_MONLA|nr:hypothetical protein EYC80_001215 [Monilinia laxa]
MEDIYSRSEAETRKLLRQRKKRTRTSCYPCRTRKVKCDKASPCKNCALRCYPELCKYSNEPGPKGASSEASTPRQSASFPGAQTSQTRISQDVTAQRNPELGTPPIVSSTDLVPDSINASNRQNNLTHVVNVNRGPSEKDSTAVDDVIKAENRRPFLGINSVPNFLRDQAQSGHSPQSATTEVIDSAVMPLLGLSNTRSKSTYPFFQPSGASPGSAGNIRQALPSNIEVFRLFECHRLHSHPFTPIIPDLADFELGLCSYLESRDQLNEEPGSGEYNLLDTSNWRSVAWLGSLYAVLASGLRYSENTNIQIQENSQLYLRYSFQCLRMANFLTRPSLLCVQTLLLLGNVLQNDTKPESAWMLLGTTARMAQSLGIHTQKHKDSSPSRKLWLSLVWQDSLLSLCFDRIPVTRPNTTAEDLRDNLSYTEAMRFLCDRTLRSDSLWKYSESPDLAGILEDVSSVEQIRSKSIGLNGEPHQLNFVQRCETSILNLHISFVIAWLCRPALRSRDSIKRTPAHSQLVDKCYKNLVECVRAFVQLHSMSIVASRSWSVIHNGLSSALLLGLLGGTARDPEVRKLQGKILDIFSGGQEIATGLDSETNPELSPPHARAIAALRRVYSQYDKDDAQISGGRKNPPEDTQEHVYPGQENSTNMEAAPFQPAWYEGPTNEFSPLGTLDSIIWDPNTIDESIPIGLSNSPKNSLLNWYITYLFPIPVFKRHPNTQ